MDQPVVPLGRQRPERADAARNRQQLLQVARAMLAEHGADKLTMDGLAAAAGLGKGTAFRRFGLPHIRMLLGQLDLEAADLPMLALQLTAALDGPLMLDLAASAPEAAGDALLARISRSREDLIGRVPRGN